VAADAPTLLRRSDDFRRFAAAPLTLPLPRCRDIRLILTPPYRHTRQREPRRQAAALISAIADARTRDARCHISPRCRCFFVILLFFFDTPCRYAAAISFFAS